MIESVDDDFIEDFEEAGIHLDFAPFHLGFVWIVDPSCLGLAVTGADVSVRELEDVFALSELLYLRSVSHGT